MSIIRCGWLVLLAACGGTTEPTTLPSTARDQSSTARDQSSTGRVQTRVEIVGARGDQLLYLDSSTQPWSVRAVEGLAETRVVAYVGNRVAARSQEAFAVFDDARVVHRGALPELRSALEPRVAEVMAAFEEEWGSGPDSDEDLYVYGALLERDGQLHVQAQVRMVKFSGEMEGCLESPENLVAPLGVDVGTDARSAVESIHLWRSEVSHDGWQCVHHDLGMGAEVPAPSWLESSMVELAVQVPYVQQACDEEYGDEPGPEGNAWQRFEECTSAVRLYACARQGHDYRFFSIGGEEGMGCFGNPQLHVFEGTELVVSVGYDAHINELPDGTLVMGGTEGWWVLPAGQAPIPFGSVRPSVR